KLFAQTQRQLVPIDAPLGLPLGRISIHGRSCEHYRDCDRALRRLVIRFFPITLGPMRMLTERGLTLKARISALGYRAIECYPGPAPDVWGSPRQHKARNRRLAGLAELGVRGLTGGA